MALQLGIHVLCKLQRLVHLEAFGEGGPQSGGGGGGAGTQGGLGRNQKTFERTESRIYKVRVLPLCDE